MSQKSCAPSPKSDQVTKKEVGMVYPSVRFSSVAKSRNQPIHSDYHLQLNQKVKKSLLVQQRIQHDAAADVDVAVLGRQRLVGIEYIAETGHAKQPGKIGGRWRVSIRQDLRGLVGSMMRIAVVVAAVVVVAVAPRRLQAILEGGKSWWRVSPKLKRPKRINEHCRPMPAYRFRAFTSGAGSSREDVERLAIFGGSSLGTISIKKSNWSDRETALATSLRCNVLRLFSSAFNQALLVISQIKISQL